MLRFISACFLLLTLAAMAENSQHNLMPVPVSVEWHEGRFVIDGSFHVVIHGASDSRLNDAAGGTIQRLEKHTGLSFKKNAMTKKAPLIIECASLAAEIPRVDEDESYTLEVSKTQIMLRAPTTRGAMHGLETLIQLVESGDNSWFARCVLITDRPRFPWRGLMIDVCRHWQPMEVIKRNLDGMAVVKLNVLHLHLTDDQGFRIESKTFPRLHELGADGHYFTQDQIRELIAYAAARGIRVVPEFDIPGHATSWLVGYPDLASLPGPYMIERKWGVFDPVLDPTNPKVYELLAGFLGEMADLFPDAYLHIGGDENNGRQWNASPGIQAFIREHNLKDDAGLHAYFNSRVHAILAKHGKKLIGWDEILHPDLTADSVVHSWRGAEGIAAATQRGYATLLSNGYYIDLCYPAAKHYLNDPMPPDSNLTEGQRRLVLGGEATMWSEWVSPETIDSRIWPRTAAIAERLWSPQEIRDVPDMYRRLAIVSRRLEEAGLKHESYLDLALRRLAGETATASDLQSLRLFVDLLEPVKQYVRGQHQPAATQFTALTGLVDCVRPDSVWNRELAEAVDNFLSTSRSPDAGPRVAKILAAWHESTMQLLKRLPQLSPRLNEAGSLLHDIADATAAGEKAQETIRNGSKLAPEDAREMLETVQRAAQSRAAVEFPASALLEKLINAATVGLPSGR